MQAWSHACFSWWWTWERVGEGRERRECFIRTSWPAAGLKYMVRRHTAGMSSRLPYVPRSTKGIGQFQFAEIQAISYSVTREKAPIYTMGSPDVRSFSRNKRGVAGSLIWINFDRHALLTLVHRLRGRFIANVDDIRPQLPAGARQRPVGRLASLLCREVGFPVGGRPVTSRPSCRNTWFLPSRPASCRPTRAPVVVQCKKS